MIYALAPTGPVVPPDGNLLVLAGAAYPLGYFMGSALRRPDFTPENERLRRRLGVLFFWFSLLAWLVSAIISTAPPLLPERPLSLAGAAAVFGIGPALGATRAWFTSPPRGGAHPEIRHGETWGLYVGGLSTAAWFGYWLHGG